MKSRTVILSFLIGTIILAMCFEYSWAQSKADKPSLKIGVVSVQEIFRDCKRSKKHGEELNFEESKVNAELNKLKKEIEADEAGLETLKRESNDYLELERAVEQKRASYLSQKKFCEKQLELKDLGWVQEFYKDILRVTGEVAGEKGFDLVFEMSEPNFSMPGSAQLLMAIRTHKLLYSGGCLDITQEVMARLDEEK